MKGLISPIRSCAGAEGFPRRASKVASLLGRVAVLAGALITTTLVLVFPPLVYRRICELPLWLDVLVIAEIVFGLALAVVATVQTL